MSPEEIAALRALAETATPGPWYWRNTGDAYLFGTRSKVVMAFRRMGMNSAQPVFRDHATNLLVDGGKANINAFPDAAFIAAARTAVPALLDALEVAEAESRWLTDVAETNQSAYEHAVEGRTKAEAELARLREGIAAWIARPGLVVELRALLDGPQ